MIYIYSLEDGKCVDEYPDNTVDAVIEGDWPNDFYWAYVAPGLDGYDPHFDFEEN